MNNDNLKDITTNQRYEEHYFLVGSALGALENLDKMQLFLD